MKVTRKYTARAVDNQTLQPSTVEGEVELPDNYPLHSYVKTARGRIAQAGKTATDMEIDGKKVFL